MHRVLTNRSSLFVPVAAGICAALLILVMTSKYGIGLSPDSACYLSIAENLLNGNGYAIYDLEPAVAWPPLYPTLLAAAGIFKIELAVWARVLSSLLFGLIVFITARQVLGQVSRWAFAIFAIAGTVMSLPLIHIAKHAWSEPLFVLLVILFLFRLEKSCAGHTGKDVLILAILAALACLTRYLGVTLILFYFLWLAFLKIEFKRKLYYGSLFTMVSAAPLLIWLYRNYQLTESLTGGRGEAGSDFINNVYQAVDSVSIWFLPVEIPAGARIILTGVPLILATAYYFRKNFRRINSDGIAPVLLTQGGFAALYVLCLLVASSLVAFDPVHHRLLAPIYLPLLFSLVFAADQTIADSDISQRKFKFIPGLLLLVWVGYLAYNTGIEIKTGFTDGAGEYSTTFWRESELAAFLSQNPPKGKTYSNYPDALYILSGVPASLAPRKHIYRSPNEPTPDIEKLQAEIKLLNQVNLAWFTKAKRGFLFEPNELQFSFDLTLIYEFSDGALYRVASKPPA